MMTNWGWVIQERTTALINRTSAAIRGAAIEIRPGDFSEAERYAAVLEAIKDMHRRVGEIIEEEQKAPQ